MVVQPGLCRTSSEKDRFSHDMAHFLFQNRAVSPKTDLNPKGVYIDITKNCIEFIIEMSIKMVL